MDPDLPIFASVLSRQFVQLPQALKDRYAVRPYCLDEVVIKGMLDIRVASLVGLMSRVFGVLVPYSGQDVPVTVRFSSGVDSCALNFEREFLYPKGKTVRFNSRLEWRNGNELVERMRLGLGWRFTCEWDGEKIRLKHKGYVLRILNHDIPVPAEFLLGSGYGEEEAIARDEFRMLACTSHPWFGRTFSYEGRFQIREVSCPDRS